METGKIIGGLISVAIWFGSVGLLGYAAKTLMFAAAEDQKHSITATTN